MTTLRGWIAEYSAQGMEGEAWQIFQDAACAESRTANWDFAGMHMLQVGDALKIWDAHGVVIWQGVLRARRGGFLWLKLICPGAWDWSPEGVPVETWRGWFQHQPPLEAEFRRETKARGA